MSRKDEYLESMVTDLGSVYYQTLQGEATEEDMARAVEAVRSQRAATAGSAVGQAPGQRHGKWRVKDVMATDVITVDRNMPFHQVVRVLTENDLSAVPVVSGGGHVLGMISEADVLRKEERFFSRLGSGLPRRSHRERQQAEALTAEGLMTRPAITIHPDAPLGEAASLMNGKHIRRLPVVSPARELIGLVSRRDLLAAFLRPDGEIAAEIADDLMRGVAGSPVRVAVTVTEGEVTLSGELPTADLVARAAKLAAEVDGVVGVLNRLTVCRPGEPASQRASQLPAGECPRGCRG